MEYPQIQEDDIVIIGSYYALTPVLRDKVLELLERAHDMHAIIYYDPNFRSSHKEEAIKLAPTIIENLEYANIVRGSQEDFFYMWGLQEADKIYKDKVKFYCRNFLCTAGAEQVSLHGLKIHAICGRTASGLTNSPVFLSFLLFALFVYSLYLSIRAMNRKETDSTLQPS